MSDADIFRRLRDLERRAGRLEGLEGRRLIAARIYNSADQSIATATVTTVTFNSQRYDTDALSVGGVMTAASAGVYRIGGHVRFASNATGQRVLYLELNGGTFIAIESQPAVNGAPTDMGIATEYELAAGDVVRLRVFQDSGGALNVTAAGNYSPEFWISKW